MTKWEYNFIRHAKPRMLAVTLNKLGLEGWELVSTSSVPGDPEEETPGAGSPAWIAFLKRPMP